MRFIQQYRWDFDIGMLIVIFVINVTAVTIGDARSRTTAYGSKTDVFSPHALTIMVPWHADATTIQCKRIPIRYQFAIICSQENSKINRMWCANVPEVRNGLYRHFNLHKIELI